MIKDLKNKLKDVQILSVILSVLALGIIIGYLSGGGFVKPLDVEEVSKIESDTFYQFIPKEASIEEALAGGHYSHCVAYPGIGVVFSGTYEDGSLQIGSTPLTYPLAKAKLPLGAKVSTPLDVMKGDLGSPLKLEYKIGLKNESVIIPRVLVKKCYRKLPMGKELEGYGKGSMEQ